MYVADEGELPTTTKKNNTGCNKINNNNRGNLKWIIKVK